MISLRALKAQRAEPFVEDQYTWRERNEITMRRSRTLWGRDRLFVGNQQWPARIVLAIATLATLYLAAIFGCLIGVGLFYRIGSP